MYQPYVKYIKRFDRDIHKWCVFCISGSMVSWVKDCDSEQEADDFMTA